jgi:NAD(P)-dependent dehydrogenase (short-subunit alcohol dehydrogenase family)
MFIGKGKGSLMTKTVLITGTGSGFGLGASLELARRGYDVIATTQIVSVPKSGTLTCW